MAVEQKRMQQIRGTAANWSTSNPTLLEGEIGLETDTRRFKVGPGLWNSLPYFFIPPPLDNWVATTPPTVNDDVSQGYDNGSRWFDTASGANLYTCVDPALGAAVWLPIAEPVDAVITGAIAMWPTAVAPAGYLLCQGQSVSRTTYAGLFAVIGTTYGSVDGNSFNVPDGRGRGMMGSGTSPDSAEGGGAGTLRVLAQKIGKEGHTLQISEIPPHTHSYSLRAIDNNRAPGSSGNADNSTTGSTTGSAGGGAAHTLINPFLVVNFIIKT